MKITTKLSIAAFAVSSFISASVLADEVRTVERYNNHGGSSLVYRQCEPFARTQSVAVYSRGQGVGTTIVRDNGPASPRFTVREDSHGTLHFIHTAE